MCLKPAQQSRKQAGSSLIAAIFVIVVIAALVAAMANLVVSSQQAYSYEILATRAYLAAESGIEIATQQSLNGSPGGCAAVSNTQPNLSNTAGFVGCSVTNSCNAIAINGTDYFTLTSRGECGVGNDKAFRQISVRVHK